MIKGAYFFEIMSEKSCPNGRVAFCYNFLVFLPASFKQSMLPVQANKDPKEIPTLLQSYSIFCSNQTYQQRSPSFKKKIQNGDHLTIKMVISAIKNLLTYRDICNIDDIVRVEALDRQSINVADDFEIDLNEFSKLLALRFLRETYFEHNYLFISYANQELSKILLRIALFKKQSQDEERGRYMFHPGCKVFEPIKEHNGNGRKIDKQIETIAFSIHKITLEVLFTCGQTNAYLPNHEIYIKQGNEKQNERFKNSIYCAYERLKQEQVKFPTKFHYFKEKDAQKISRQYQKAPFNDQAHHFYLPVLQQVWSIIQTIISDGNYQQGNLYTYLLTFTAGSTTGLQSRLAFCSKIVMETCDRHFWRYLNEFLDSKIRQLKSTLQLAESLTEKQLKAILGIHLFVLFFNYCLLQPEIMYLIEHKYIQELVNIFVIVLKAYGKVSQVKKSQGYRITKNAKALPLQGDLNCMQVLKSLLFCFRRFKQFSIEFAHHFHQKLNTNHNYPLISMYSDIIVKIEAVGNKMIENWEIKGKVERNIMQRMGRNHQFYFKKQQFLFTYYEKQASIEYNIKEMLQKFKTAVDVIIDRYPQFIRTVDAIQPTPLIQYINLSKQGIMQQEVQIATTKISNKQIRGRNSYRLNLMNAERRFLSQGKGSVDLNSQSSQRLPSIKSAIGSPLSFVQSLKVNIPRPNEVLVKSLSSSRKYRRINHQSSQNLNSYTSNQPSQMSQSISIQKQNRQTALPPFSTPPQFKHVFIENIQVPIFEKSLQSPSTPLKSSMKRIHKLSRNTQMVTSKYINNFMKGNRTQPKHEPLEPASVMKERMIESPSEFLKLQSKQTQKIQLQPQQYIFPKQQSSFKKQLSNTRSFKQFQRQHIGQSPSQQLIQQQFSKKQCSSETTMCFYFSPKAKKELLKKKVLVKKQGCLEIGMIANLQQDIVTTELSTIKRYALMIKIYITALAPLQKVNINMKLPNWLQCVSKAGLSRETMKEQSQFISTFIVQLKSSREKIIKRNYGDLPLLNVVYLDRNERKEVISEPLFILVNRFSIEKMLTQEQFAQMVLEKGKITMPFLVHERIGSDIRSMRQFFPSVTTFNMQITEKMRLFQTQQMIPGDNLAVVKLEFVKNHQQILLIFFEGKIHTQHDNRNTPEKSHLFVELLPIRQAEWQYEDLHIFETSLRSILCSDR